IYDGVDNGKSNEAKNTASPPRPRHDSATSGLCCVIDSTSGYPLAVLCCHITGPRRRFSEYGKPYQGDPSSYVARRPQHFGTRRRAHVARSHLQSLPQSGDRGSSSTRPNRCDHASYYDRTHLGPADGGQSTLTPDIYWRLFTDPELTPPGHTTSQVVTAESFLGLAHQNLKHKSPFAPEIRDKPVPTNFRLPILESYDGSSDSTEHVAAFRAQMTLYNSSDALTCQLFPTTLRGPARMWYNSLKPASIISFDQLAKELEQNFLANVRLKPTTTSLLGIAQGREEPLAQFINRFTIETRAIPNVHPSLVIQAFLIGIRSSKLFWSLVKKSPTIILEMMQRANHFIAVETLIAGKHEQQKHPCTEKPRGPNSGPSRRRKRGQTSVAHDPRPLLLTPRGSRFPPNKRERAPGTPKPHQDLTRGKG
ncbi:hypothetical protein BHE74_00051837, partial [Ensete ventricosum]